jgi:hypothetical protein
LRVEEPGSHSTIAGRRRSPAAGRRSSRAREPRVSDVADNLSVARRAVFRAVGSNAAMHSKTKHVLRCPECGSRTFEIHGPTNDNASVRCAECAAELGQLDAVLALIETRIESQELERRRRRSH